MSHPENEATLQAFCAEHGYAYVIDDAGENYPREKWSWRYHIAVTRDDGEQANGWCSDLANCIVLAISNAMDRFDLHAYYVQKHEAKIRAHEVQQRPLWEGAA